MPAITPNLWFDTEALEAAEFYCSVFPNSKITNVTHHGEAGRVMRTWCSPSSSSSTASPPGAQRRPRVPLHRGHLPVDQLRRPGRGRPLLGRPGRRRRHAQRVRLAEGPLRPVVAGGTGGHGAAPPRPRHGPRPARHGGDDEDDQARHGRTAARRRRGPRRVTEPPPTPAAAYHHPRASSASTNAGRRRCSSFTARARSTTTSPLPWALAASCISLSRSATERYAGRPVATRAASSSASY